MHTHHILEKSFHTNFCFIPKGIKKIPHIKNLSNLHQYQFYKHFVSANPGCRLLIQIIINMLKI